MTAKKKTLIELMLDAGITPESLKEGAEYFVSDEPDKPGDSWISGYDCIPTFIPKSHEFHHKGYVYCLAKTPYHPAKQGSQVVTKQQFIDAYNERNKKPEWPAESNIDEVAQNGESPFDDLMPVEYEDVKKATNKYQREIKPSVFVDVYDVLKAWNVTNPALQHLIKKALQPGNRGHKTLEQDIDDIIASAKRAKGLL